MIMTMKVIAITNTCLHTTSITDTRTTNKHGVDLNVNQMRQDPKAAIKHSVNLLVPVTYTSTTLTYKHYLKKVSSSI